MALICFTKRSISSSLSSYLVAVVTQHAFHTVKPSTDTGEARNLEDQWGIKQKSNKPPTALKMLFPFTVNQHEVLQADK